MTDSIQSLLNKKRTVKQYDGKLKVKSLINSTYYYTISNVLLHCFCNKKVLDKYTMPLQNYIDLKILYVCELERNNLNSLQMVIFVSTKLNTKHTTNHQNPRKTTNKK